MEITKLRIKKDYAPLNVHCSIVVPTNGHSALLQTYSLKTNEYNPNRQLSPLVIRPNVLAYAPDGSLNSPYANGNLGEYNWYVNDTLISEVWTQSTKDANGNVTAVNDYDILTVGSDRGVLLVYKNIPVNEQVRLRFEGVVADNRLGQNIEVKSKEVVLRTTVLAEYQYKVSLGSDSVLHYNPFTDPLLLYEHKVAEGISQTITEAEAKADKLSYLCNIPVAVFKGDRQAEAKDNFAIELYRIGSDGTETRINPADYNEVLELDKFHILFDLRLIKLENYAVVVKVDNEEKCRIQFAVRRLEPKYTKPVNGNQTDIRPTATQRYDFVQVEYNGHILECPGLSLKIDWYTNSAYKTNVQHNEGEETLITLLKTGIGDNFNDDWLEIETRSEYKPAYKIATENSDYDDSTDPMCTEEDDLWTDENGNILIFN